MAIYSKKKRTWALVASSLQNTWGAGVRGITASECGCDDPVKSDAPALVRDPLASDTLQQTNLYHESKSYFQIAPYSYSSCATHEKKILS